MELAPYEIIQPTATILIPFDWISYLFWIGLAGMFGSFISGFYVTAKYAWYLMRPYLPGYTEVQYIPPERMKKWSGTLPLVIITSLMCALPRAAEARSKSEVYSPYNSAVMNWVYEQWVSYEVFCSLNPIGGTFATIGFGMSFIISIWILSFFVKAYLYKRGKVY